MESNASTFTVLQNGQRQVKKCKKIQDYTVNEVRWATNTLIHCDKFLLTAHFLHPEIKLA
jgi:hypothetical protein